MNKDEITQKISLLPEGLAEKNIKSWENVLRFYKMGVSIPGNEWLTPMVDLIQIIFASEQQKIFRAGLQLFTLMISTKEEHGLEERDAYIVIYLADDGSVDIGYYAATAKQADVFACKNNEAISVLQPLLDRLWNETQGKKNV